MAEPVSTILPLSRVFARKDSPAPYVIEVSCAATEIKFEQTAAKFAFAAS